MNQVAKIFLPGYSNSHTDAHEIKTGDIQSKAKYNRLVGLFQELGLNSWI